MSGRTAADIAYGIWSLTLAVAWLWKERHNERKAER